LTSTRTTPRLALNRAEAAASLGVSLRFFEEHIQSELRLVYRGRRRLVPISQLERWLEREAVRSLDQSDRPFPLETRKPGSAGPQGSRDNTDNAREYQPPPVAAA
jgi:excisionase family DNA binding protein